MSNILAIDTSTDACSVALYRDGRYSDLHEIIPRQHNQRIFSMLRELLPGGDLRAQGIDAIAYGSGPGSFTGLRIAASVVQGLAYANDLPVVPVSTLACQAQTALRKRIVTESDLVLSMLDARINEVYWALFSFHDNLAKQSTEPAVCAPQDVQLAEAVAGLKGIGSGFRDRQLLPDDLLSATSVIEADLLPTARDIIPLAEREYAMGNSLKASEVTPVYVREEISWKKLPQQGRPQ